ncbi:hypothetical protein GO013_09375 [Pseudodesulfovibrio sp. JC047]|uniref:hypothetical protein n=1 Tax=Pseudodesulfovibrio sp. JC047 TaxID=2683199 RepID=UPI0013D4BF05|nr:hypothetical protein [Pseudodesulfovibrio sp. JC047]NDV19628.1 hypothetical protein [Pseudodesulfovibrio sp. JC047]
MTITPSDLFQLATQRHRQPWNWSLHFTALISCCLAVLFHSPFFLTATIILGAVGFLELRMKTTPNTRWFRFVHAGIEWEKDWFATPWNTGKWTRFLLVFCIAIFFLWALWSRELAALALIIGFGALIRVMVENYKNGIKP